jgi:hypothetical protein
MMAEPSEGRHAARSSANRLPAVAPDSEYRADDNDTLVARIEARLAVTFFWHFSPDQSCSFC